MNKLVKLLIGFDILVLAAFTVLYLPSLKEQVVTRLQDSPELIHVLYGSQQEINKEKTDATLALVDQSIVEDIEVSNVKVTRLSVVATGDALIHSTVYNTHKTSSGYDFTDIFDYVGPIVQQYDIGYYNQETVLGGTELGLSNYPQFNSPQEVGDAFIAAGFNLVSLANNHTLDGIFKYGLKAVGNQREYFDRQYEEYGVIATGSWRSWEERSKIVIGEIKGVTYAMLSYTTLTNMLEPPKGKEYCTNKWSEEKALEDIATYRDKVDVLIVAMHWGVDYVFTPNAQQKQIAQFLSENGVDIVFGAHAHYIQPIDMVGDTLVFYGLGNFVAAQNEEKRKYSMTGMLGTFDIVKTEVDGQVKITFENVGAQPTYIFRSKKFKVIPYNSFTNKDKSNHDELYEKFKGVLTSMWDEVIVY